MIHQKDLIKLQQLSETKQLKARDTFQYTCQKCKHEINRKCKDIKNRPQSCPVCAGKQVIVGFNDALTAQPALANIWSSKNECTPEDFTKQSAQKAYIKCNTCSETTLRKICDVVRKPESCAYCAGRIIIPGKNDLQTKYPKLALEWSPNNPKKANQTYPHGRLRGLWKCIKCHQEWETMISSRVLYKTGCPFCTNQKPTPGINDVSSHHELLQSWDFSKNSIQPNTLMRGSNTKVWWKCIKGHSHHVSPSQKWDSKNNRIRQCPSCLRRQRSYGEIEIEKLLNDAGHKVICNTRQVLKPLEIDLWIPKRNFAIEFNGVYWHSDKMIKGKYNITAYEYHERKIQLAREKSIIIVYIWADDWTHQPERIKNALHHALETPHDIDPIITTMSKG